MAFQISPGVNITEKDVTLLVPAVATTPAGMVGLFQWGPGNEPITITSEKELAQIFGKPVKASGSLSSPSDTSAGVAAKYNRWWWTAANFLSYGNNIKIVRFINSGSTRSITATSGTVGVNGETLCGATSYAALTTTPTSPTTYGYWAAKYPGSLGNSLKVVVLDYYSSKEGYGKDTNIDSDQYADYLKYFDGLPGTSPWASALTGATMKDEIHVLIIDSNGSFSGTAGTILEKFAYLSKASNSVNQNGTSNYYKDVLNRESQYVWLLNHIDTTVSINTSNTVCAAVTASAGTAWGSVLTSSSSTAFKVVSETSGENIVISNLYSGTLDSTTPADSDISSAFATYMGDPEIIDVSLFLTGPLGKTAAYAVAAVAESRKDVVAFLSPTPTSFNQTPSAYLDDIKTFRTNGTSTSYGVADTGYKLQYDNYNDEYVYIPLNGDIAGLCVRTDENNDPWFSPAGLNRGLINRVVKLPFNPNQAQRDDLYKIGMNPVVAFPGVGPVLYGDKTLLSRPSAFDRINVRRLFIILEKSIATAAKYQLFEFNDEFTRAQFVNLVTPFLRNVLGRRGITDFRVVCDETNNTPYVIDSNNFVADIYIKPNKSINFIQLNFIATPSGLSFEEVVGA
jgi:phage tail sheath protein FI